MADNKNNKDVQQRNQEISRLKRLNQGLRNKSISKQKDKSLDTPAADSALFSFFDIFRFG